MKPNKKFIIGVSALVVAIIVLLNIFYQNKPQPQAGSKAFTLEVIDDQGAEKAYSGKTDAEYLADLMKELQAQGDFSYEGETGEYGLFISTVNGLTADYDTNGAYWSIMVNGEYGQYGADAQPVADGDDFQLVYTTN